MKFSTTPILLTSLALSSASSLAAPLPAQNTNNLEVRSPKPDEYEFDSPLLSKSNEGKSPLLGASGGAGSGYPGKGRPSSSSVSTMASTLQSNSNSKSDSETDGSGGKGSWGKAFVQGRGMPGGVGAGFGWRSWSMKRQLATSTTPSDADADAQAQVQRLQSQAQGAVQGQDLSPIPLAAANNGLPLVGGNGVPVPNLDALGLGAVNQAEALGQNAAQPLTLTAQGLIPQGTQGAVNGLLGTAAAGLTSGGAPGVLGGLGGLGGTVAGVTGAAGGLTSASSTLSGLAGQVSGVTNGLPIVGGVASGLLGTATNTLGGLSNVGGLASGLPVVGGGLGAATSTVTELTGQLGAGAAANGLPNINVNGLTDGLPLVGGLMNGLPLPSVSGLPLVGGLTSGLTTGTGPSTTASALSNIGGTLNGLASAATNLASPSGGQSGQGTGTGTLAGVASTLGGLGLGDPTRQLSGVGSALSGLTGTVGTLGTPAHDGSTLSSASAFNGLTGVSSTASQAVPQSVKSLGNVVQSLGSGTYLLSSGQVLSMPQQLQLAQEASSSLPPSAAGAGAGAQPATDALTSLLSQGLSVVQVNGKMYVLNAVGQTIAALPETSTIQNVDVANEATPLGNYYQSPSSPSLASQAGPAAASSGPTKEQGYNGPLLFSPSSDPSATDLIAQAMSGTERTSAYSSLIPPALDGTAGETPLNVMSSASSFIGQQRTATRSLPTPTAPITDSAPRDDTATTAIPTAALTAGSEDIDQWFSASTTTSTSTSSTSTSSGIIFSAPTAAITAVATAMDRSLDDTDTWGEFVSATMAPTTLWAGAAMAVPTGAPTGAVGSEMVPQVSAGLA